MAPEVISKQQSIREVLNDLGVPKHYLGYDALVCCIEYVMSDPKIQFTKELYPKVSKDLGTTPGAVERNSRHVIEASFGKIEDWSLVRKYFGNTIDPIKGCPTNKHFICTIAKYIVEGY